MKLSKIFGVSALALTLVACSSSTASSTATPVSTAAPEETEAAAEVVTEGTYEVTNNTGKTVTELYFYDATGEDKGSNYLEGELKDGDSETFVVVVDADKADGYAMKVEYVTEDGESVVVFENLHLEEASVYLKSAADVESGATPFSKPE